MEFKLLFLCICFVSQGTLVAQSDTVTVKEVALSNSRLVTYKVGSKYITVDSLDSYFNNLAAAIQNVGGVFVKSYGGGSLATSSIRGGNGNQTAVLWNGLPINSSMNAISDFSLIPSSLFNEVGVEFGGTSSAWGSGGFGGAVHLNNKSSFGSGLKVRAGFKFGSFGVNTQKVKISSSTDKYVFSVALSADGAKNDFPFYKKSAGNDSLVSQNHSNYNSLGALGQYKYKLKKNSFLVFVVNIFYFLSFF